MRTAILGLAVLLVATKVARADDVSTTTVAEAKMYVVPVVCEPQALPLGTRFAPYVVGTGFFINKRGDVVTAGHVAQAIKDAASNGQCAVAEVYVSSGGWRHTARETESFMPIKITSCNADLSVDIAVCEIEANPFQEKSLNANVAVATLDTTQQADGADIAFTGFPLSHLAPVTSKGSVAAYDFGNASQPEVVIDKNAWPGASGSPIYAGSGRVIGMLIETGSNAGAGLSYARTAAAVKAYLQKNNIPTN
jgi:V8-like Glu-specific endopeptidase